MVGIIGRKLLETGERIRRLGSNLCACPSGESGQWGWKRKGSTEGKEGEGERGSETLEHNEG